VTTTILCRKINDNDDTFDSDSDRTILFDSESRYNHPTEAREVVNIYIIKNRNTTSAYTHT